MPVAQTKGLNDPELATKSGKTTFTEYQKIFNILPRFPNSVSSYKMVYMIIPMWVIKHVRC